MNKQERIDYRHSQLPTYRLLQILDEHYHLYCQQNQHRTFTKAEAFHAVARSFPARVRLLVHEAFPIN